MVYELREVVNAGVNMIDYLFNMVWTVSAGLLSLVALLRSWPWCALQGIAINCESGEKRIGFYLLGI